MFLFDILVILVFFLTQWRLTVLWLRAAQRRWPGRRSIRKAIFGFDVLVVMGYICSSSDFLSHLSLPPQLPLIFGGIALGYLMSATMVLAVYTVWNALIRRLPERPDPGRRAVLSAASGVLMAAPVAVFGYGALVQRTNFRVREIDVPLSGLPRDLEGLRILQLSDIHLSAFLTEPELARVIDASLELRPNLAVITGDLISFHGDPLDACIRQLARLRADAGVFGCMGNHERYAHAEKAAAEAGARVGIPFLRMEARRLKFGDAVMNLAGVDHQSMNRQRHYLAGAERLIEPGAFNLLLSHNPDVFPVAAAQGYDFVLAGHTHGGQVNVEILDQGVNPARFFTPFVYGLYRRGTAAAYVTRGIGTIGIPARIGAPPEITVVRLRKA